MMENNEERRFRGQRGPDKVQRKLRGPGPTKPKKPEAERTKTFQVYLRQADRDKLVEYYGGLTEAMKHLLKLFEN